ncbi:GGDEF domain-containing protein [bacterium]|nr:GGDEF domain-containing protein [bacterium]
MQIPDITFQPIVNVHSGNCYGFEGKLVNNEKADVELSKSFDASDIINMKLLKAEITQKELIIARFSEFDVKAESRLFLDTDLNLLCCANNYIRRIVELLKKYKLTEESVCFEISVKESCSEKVNIHEVISECRKYGFNIAIDHFGSRYSGLQLLYMAEPDFIKIDSFFIQNIHQDLKKRLFISSILNISHLSGSTVIAEGICEKKEFYGCRELGFGLVQGDFIQPPESSIDRLQQRYQHIHDLAQGDRRKTESDQRLMRAQMEPMEPLVNHQSVFELFDRFCQRKELTLIPIVNHQGEPIGIVSEKDLKVYTYSQFGMELLRNRSYGKTIMNFVKKIPITDVHTSAEKVLELYALKENMEGILLTDDMKYIGFLDAHAILKIFNEKNLALARDQNPLSSLPGNKVIYEYVSRVLPDTKESYSLVYFDFDNFKPFNDKYGFRQGDRAILLFSDIMRVHAGYHQRFAGHIGGDDFFMGFRNENHREVEKLVKQLINQFKKDVESFYDQEALENGFVVSRDREGMEKKFPLLTVSAVIFLLPEDRKVCTVEELGGYLALHKKEAKRSPSGICYANIEEHRPQSVFNLDKVACTTPVD